VAATRRQGDEASRIEHIAHCVSGPLDLNSAQQDKLVARLTVRDHDHGAPEEAIARLGEGFYRPNERREARGERREARGERREARARAQGGLGLNLFKMFAAAQGGRMDIRNASPGLEVRLDLPIT